MKSLVVRGGDGWRPQMLHSWMAPRVETGAGYRELTCFATLKEKGASFMWPVATSMRM